MQSTMRFYDVYFIVRFQSDRYSCPFTSQHYFDVDFIIWKFVFIQSNDHKNADDKKRRKAKLPSVFVMSSIQNWLPKVVAFDFLCHKNESISLLQE